MEEEYNMIYLITAVG